MVKGWKECCVVGWLGDCPSHRCLSLLLTSEAISSKTYLMQSIRFDCEFLEMAVCCWLGSSQSRRYSPHILRQSRTGRIYRLKHTIIGYKEVSDAAGRC